jgi:hypothetical protein
MRHPGRPCISVQVRAISKMSVQIRAKWHGRCTDVPRTARTFLLAPQKRTTETCRAIKHRGCVKTVTIYVSRHTASGHLKTLATTWILFKYMTGSPFLKVGRRSVAIEEDEIPRKRREKHRFKGLASRTKRHRTLSSNSEGRVCKIITQKISEHA